MDKPNEFFLILNLHCIVRDNPKPIKSRDPATGFLGKGCSWAFWMGRVRSASWRTLPDLVQQHPQSPAWATCWHTLVVANIVWPIIHGTCVTSLFIHSYLEKQPSICTMAGKRWGGLVNRLEDSMMVTGRSTTRGFFSCLFWLISSKRGVQSAE